MTAGLVIVEPDDVDCPSCEGRGEEGTGRYEHDTGAEITRDCSTCHGTGQLDRELVRECEDCQGAYLVEMGGCEHRDLCPTCGPVCRQCFRDQAYEAQAELLHDAARLREVSR